MSSKDSWPELNEYFRDQPELLGEMVRDNAARVVEWIENGRIGELLPIAEVEDERLVEAVPALWHAVRLLDRAPTVALLHEPDAHMTVVLELVDDVSRAEVAALLHDNPALYQMPVSWPRSTSWCR